MDALFLGILFQRCEDGSDIIKPSKKERMRRTEVSRKRRVFMENMINQTHIIDEMEVVEERIGNDRVYSNGKKYDFLL